MLFDAMLGSCNVAMAKPSGCSVKVQARHPAFGFSDTEREVEEPLLEDGGHGEYVQELDGFTVDSERCLPPQGRACEFEALATMPVELIAVLPASYKRGTPIKMHGPHGPVEVTPPDEAEPGAPVRYRLAPMPEFRIRVPPDCRAGSIIRFERSDGVEVAVAVPEHLQAGDLFEVTPPSMMVRVPEGAQPGDRVIFRHALGESLEGREATEWCRAEVPKGVRPGAYFAARLPRPEHEASRKEAPPRSGPRIEGGIEGACTAPRFFLHGETEDI